MVINRDFKLKYVFILLFTILILLLSFSFFNKNVNAIIDLELSGEGLKDNPYKIYDENDIINFSEYVNSGGETRNKYFKLENNINLTSNFTPIGTNNYMFQGNFNGGGKSISNLNITSSSTTKSLGLFAYCNYATIENLFILSGKITQNNQYYAGGIVGQSSYNCKILNCGNVGVDIISRGNSTGGILGFSQSFITITNCFNYANISCTSANAIAGGIVGESNSLNLNECYNLGNITAQGRDREQFSVAGGIVGKGLSAQVRNSYNRGNVTANNYSYNYQDGQMNMKGFSCGMAYIKERGYPLQTRTIMAMAGGICGQYGSVYNCYNTGTVKGGYTQTTYNVNFQLFGLKLLPIGESTGYYIFDNLNFNITLQSANLAGGITGPSGTWNNCYSNGSVYKQSLPVETQNGYYFVKNRMKSFDVEILGVVSFINYTYSVKFIKNYTNCYLLFECSYKAIPGEDGSDADTSSYFKKPSSIKLNECTDKDIVSSKLGSSYASSNLINDGYPYIKSMFWQNYAK